MTASAMLAGARASQHAQLVRRVHAAATYLKLDDDTYRDAIAGQARGKRSAKDCSVNELQAVLEHFHKSGFPRPARKALTRSQKKMWALWQTLADQGKVQDRSMRGLLGWVRGQTENGVAALEWLTAAQENTLIESLKKWSARA